MDSSYAKTAVASVLAGVIGLASYGVVRETETIGEGKIVMATGSSQYYELAESYRRELERNGIKLEVQRLTEGFTTLKTMLEPNSASMPASSRGASSAVCKAGWPPKRPKAAMLSSTGFCQSGVSFMSRSGCTPGAICMSPVCATSKA